MKTKINPLGAMTLALLLTLILVGSTAEAVPSGGAIGVAMYNKCKPDYVVDKLACCDKLYENCTLSCSFYYENSTECHDNCAWGHALCVNALVASSVPRPVKGKLTLGALKMMSKPRPSIRRPIRKPIRKPLLVR